MSSWLEQLKQQLLSEGGVSAFTAVVVQSRVPDQLLYITMDKSDQLKVEMLPMQTCPSGIPRLLVSPKLTRQLEALASINDRYPHGDWEQALALLPVRWQKGWGDQYGKMVHVGPLTKSVWEWLASDDVDIDTWLTSADPEAIDFREKIQAVLNSFPRSVSGVIVGVNHYSAAATASSKDQCYSLRDVVEILKTKNQLIQALWHPVGGRYAAIEESLLPPLEIVDSGEESRLNDPEFWSRIQPIFHRYDSSSASGTSSSTAGYWSGSESSGESSSSRLPNPLKQDFLKWQSFLQPKKTDDFNEDDEYEADWQADAGPMVQYLPGTQTVPMYISFSQRYPFHQTSTMWRVFVWDNGVVAGCCPVVGEGRVSNETMSEVRLQRIARLLEEKTTDTTKRVNKFLSASDGESPIVLSYVVDYAVRDDCDEVWTVQLMPWGGVTTSEWFEWPELAQIATTTQPRPFLETIRLPETQQSQQRSLVDTMPMELLIK